MDSDTPHADSERLLVLLAYGLFLIAPPMGGLTGVIAVIIAHMRLSHARGTWLESHYRNQIRVFWTMLVYALLMMALFTLGMGYSFSTFLWPFGWPIWQGVTLVGWAMLAPVFVLLSLILVVWYYWRLLSGFVRALDDRPV